MPASDIDFQPMKEGRSKPYIDNIFHGKGNTLKDHLMILNKVFKYLLDTLVQVNLDKSTLWAVEVNFLGFC